MHGSAAMTPLAKEHVCALDKPSRRVVDQCRTAGRYPLFRLVGNDGRDRVLVGEFADGVVYLRTHRLASSHDAQTRPLAGWRTRHASVRRAADAAHVAWRIC